jgi:predicted SnoaL-like aldol condensation-catalyzing enzyme
VALSEASHSRQNYSSGGDTKLWRAPRQPKIGDRTGHRITSIIHKEDDMLHKQARVSVYVFAAAIVVALTACQPIQRVPEQQTAMTVDQEAANLAVVQDFYVEMVDNKDAEGVARYLSDDFVSHNPELVGKQGMMDWATWQQENQPTAGVVEQIHTIVKDDLVVLYYTYTSDPAKGAELTIADFFRVEDGKIVEYWDAVVPIAPPQAASEETMIELEPMTLKGRSFEYQVDDYHIQITFEDETQLRWEYLAAPDGLTGKTATETIERSDIRPDIILMRWTEEDGTNVFDVLDLGAMTIYANGVTPDGQRFVAVTELTEVEE